MRMNSRPTATQAPTHALRVNVSDRATTSAGMTSAGQIRSRDAEHEPRRRDADDQHQRARVGHVVTERAARPLAEAVVVQHAVLDDAVDRRGSADGDDDVDHRRGALAAREVVDGRDDQEEQELLVVDEAVQGVDREDRREQRDPGVGEQRQKNVGAAGRLRSRTSATTQQRAVRRAESAQRRSRAAARPRTRAAARSSTGRAPAQSAPAACRAWLPSSVHYRNSTFVPVRRDGSVGS